MSEQYEFPTEPEFPFEGAFPAHGNGGHNARDWSSYKALSINDVAALRYGMHPNFAIDYVYSSNCGTLQQGVLNSSYEEIIRAVMAGIIRTIDLDKPLRKEDITSDTMLITEDVVKYFSNDEDKRECEYPAYMSTDIKILIRAAREFWLTADPDDTSTHPINKDVSNWLKEKGFSEISAQQGATIIRPEWATKGRRKNN